jgi:catalase-peroxidase
MTYVDSFAVLEPTADAFRNYYSDNSYGLPAEMLADKADPLTLSVPEMTVLVGGMRFLNANTSEAQQGVCTTAPGVAFLFTFFEHR